MDADQLEQAGRISVGFVVHALILAATIPRILAIKRDSTAAIAWVWSVLLLPYVGAAFFWTFGDPEMRRPLRRLVRGPSIHVTRRRPRRPHRKFPQLHTMMARLGETPETTGNRVRFFTSGPRLFRSIANDMEAARHEICVQYYIVRDDRTGRAFADILKRKAREGVRVHFLYDAVGSGSLGRDFLRDLRAAGVRAFPFLPFSILRRRIQVNFRNHRKLVVVDRRVGYTGGFNVGREYANLSTEDWARRWFDAHCRIEGPAAGHLVEEFAADWAFAAEDRSMELPDNPRWLADVPVEGGDEDQGWVMTVSGGPDQQVNRVRALMFWAFARARRRLWIATPYFVPDQSILDALLGAIHSGVDVRILTQNDRPDKRVPHLAAAYFGAPLVEAGAKVYQYAPGMMHAKMFLVDDRIASIGSANVDVRSLSLNFELNCVFGSRREVRAIERIFLRAFDDSWLVTPEMFAGRSFGRRVVENFCRLFAPVL